MIEKVILVDKYNNPVGVEEKMKTHKLGLLHRAFSIFIFNNQNELMLQRRALDKYHNGGLWTNTVCSHPRPGETYQQAVHRRLAEEMGFDCKLRNRQCFIYKTKFSNGLIEHEYDCIFTGRYNNQPKINPQEAMDWKWINLEKLNQEIRKHPNYFTFWLKEIMKKKLLTSIDKIKKPSLDGFKN